MGSSQRAQPPLHGVLAGLDTGRCTEALRGDRAHGGKRILDAMMKFAEDQLLQFIGGLSLLGVDTGLDK